MIQSVKRCIRTPYVEDYNGIPFAEGDNRSPSEDGYSRTVFKYDCIRVCLRRVRIGFLSKR
eukprot:7538391-Pyramimonas_sp.AAC.1